MGWIELKVNGMPMRIDSVNPLLIQKWRERVRKDDDWEEATIYKQGKNRYVYIGGEKELIERIVYKAHNPKWKSHYSRHNIIMYKDGNKEDYSIENLMIKPTEGLRRY